MAQLQDDAAYETGLRHVGQAPRNPPCPRVFPIFLLCLLVTSLAGGCDSNQTSIHSGNSQNSKEAASSIGENPEGVELLSFPSPKTAEQDDPRIVVFGNSLTAGLGVSPDQSYPAQLQEQLNKAGYHYEVINAGVSGDTTAGGLRRLDWVLKGKPSIVIVELGANDGLRGQSLVDTYSNLEQIIQRLQAADVSVVLAGMKIPPNYGIEYTTTFASMYEQLAREYEVPLIPFLLEGVAALPELNQADGIHPTPEGHQIVAQNVMNVLEPLLQKVTRQGGPPRS